jgi:hypothetical protein
MLLGDIINVLQKFAIATEIEYLLEILERLLLDNQKFGLYRQ